MPSNFRNEYDSNGDKKHKANDDHLDSYGRQFFVLERAYGRIDSYSKTQQS